MPLCLQDEALHAAVNASPHMNAIVQLVPVNSTTKSLEMWKQWCPADAHNASLLLLLPKEYQLLNAAGGLLSELAGILAHALQRNSSIAALTFGARLPSGKVTSREPI